MSGLILGYAALNHDPSVALVDDGRVLSAVESEKVTRHKHEVSVFPERAIQFVLAAAGREWGEIDAIATNYGAGPRSNAWYLPALWRRVRARSYDPAGILNCEMLHLSHHRSVFCRLPDDHLPPIIPVSHHRAHMASAFLFSPFESAAVVVIDAYGENECTSVFHCDGRSARRLYSMDLPADSLGLVYMMATRHLGYSMLGDEYKVMGLAPYGSPNQRFRAFFTDLIRLLPDGRYRVRPQLAGRLFANGWKFPATLATLIGPRRRSDEELTDVHRDFAFELQRRIEEAILHVIRHVRRAVPARRLCLAGGVALNSVANGRVLAEGLYDDVYIPPAPHDAGTSLGAAAYHHFYTRGGRRPGPLRDAYLGCAYDDAAIESELRRCGLGFDRTADSARSAAELLVAGQVIGWFQGATEFGPRALGNRSILADPRSVDVRERLNRKVKEREAYRPFAPSILATHCADYFEHVRDSPFMAFVDRVKAGQRGRLGAVVHVDGTARPQTVIRETNPLFYDLIAHFHALTGVPAVLNTSFNVAGEPIVNTPSDAIRCFFASGLDALVIGGFVLHKSALRDSQADARLALPDAQGCSVTAVTPARPVARTRP